MDALQRSPTTSDPVPPRRPRIVDAGLLLILAGAVLNALIGVLVVVQAAAVHVAIAPVLLMAVVGISVLFGAALIVFALLLRSGRTWARAVLAAISALSLLTLFAPNALNLAVIVLLLVGDVLLYRRAVSSWVRASRGLDPA